MRQITKNLGNSDTPVYFECTSIVVFRCMSVYIHVGGYTMAGLSKCVDEFSEKSLVAIHNLLFERLSILLSTVRLHGQKM